MLAGCVRSLIARGDRVVVLARSSARLNALANTISPVDRVRLYTAAADYRDLELFDAALASIPFALDAAVCWVHTPAEPVLDRIRSRFTGIDLLRVVGSPTSIPDPGNVPDRAVRLGFVIEDNHSRWLSHAEIAQGVYNAFVSGAKRCAVGVIEPWDSRP